MPRQKARKGPGGRREALASVEQRERSKGQGTQRGARRAPRGASLWRLAGKGFEQESDMVRFYLFLLSKSLAAVWRMDWQEGRLRVETS